MTIRRLRPTYAPLELREIYDHQYDHTQWPDHVMRVEATLDCIHAWTTPSMRRIVADLSCGDAEIAKRIADTKLLLLGDYVENDAYPYHGRIEHTVMLLGFVNLFILSETLEHIDDPWNLLHWIHDKSAYLLITTRLDEQTDDTPEHYWGWDEDGIRDLLRDTDCEPVNHIIFVPPVKDPYYTYQIWLAKHVSSIT